MNFCSKLLPIYQLFKRPLPLNNDLTSARQLIKSRPDEILVLPCMLWESGLLSDFGVAYH